MRIAVVGGKLQGVEACYLSQKAGWYVRLVDCRPDVLARSLCDEFVLSDLTREEELNRVFGDVDLILPALEGQEVLDVLSRFSSMSEIPLAFDPRAYRISSSKILSDRLFAELGLPAPMPWPEAVFPLIAKPSGGSGSRDVRVIRDEKELAALPGLEKQKGGWVLQEFLEGPSYSIEVLGTPGSYQAIQVTDLFVDSSYDCKRVEASSSLPERRVEEFKQLALQLAEALQLKGLMDVEAILNQGKLKVLEIDARLPSQTPTTVWWSTGFNMLIALGDVFLGQFVPAGPLSATRAVVYEHVQATPRGLELGGEHLMIAARPLRRIEGFFGADEALSDYEPRRRDWHATLIITGKNRAEARDRRDRVLAEIRRSLRAELDPVERSENLKGSGA